MAIVSNKRSLEHVVNKVWSLLPVKYKRFGELHAHHSTESIRKRVLRLIGNAQDLKILSVIVNKNHVSLEARKNVDLLYARIARMLTAVFILMDLCAHEDLIEIIIDKKYTRETTRNVLLDHMSVPLSIAGFSKVRVRFEVSHKEKSIQAVDFISWAIFRKHEIGDTVPYECIKTKIIVEELLTIH
jgi:hypothetical protein